MRPLCWLFAVALAAALGSPATAENKRLLLVTDSGGFIHDSVGLSDTVGYANPAQVKRMFKRLASELGGKAGGAHLHNTRGQGLANVVAVRVSFERDQRKLGWGVVLVVMALVMFAISGPLGTSAEKAATEMAGAGTQGVAFALQLLFRFFAAAASLLPAIALASVLGGVALGVFGWRGNTVLTVSLAGAERVYDSRGQSKLLIDFAELVGERLMSLER